MKHKEEKECLNCCEVYKAADFVTCPNCGINQEPQHGIFTIIGEQA
jgi:hypothetical protein